MEYDRANIYIYLHTGGWKKWCKCCILMNGASAQLAKLTVIAANFGQCYFEGYHVYMY